MISQRRKPIKKHIKTLNACREKWSHSLPLESRAQSTRTKLKTLHLASEDYKDEKTEKGNRLGSLHAAERSQKTDWRSL